MSDTKQYLADIVENITLPAVKPVVKRVTVARTKAYIADNGLDQMAPADVADFLRKQADIKIALIGDAVLKQLEFLEAAVDWQERQSISMTITALTKAASEVANTKQKFEQSIGLPTAAKAAELIEKRQKELAIAAKPREMTADEFAAAYEDATRASGTVPMAPVKA